MAIVGSVLVYGAVILMGVDHATLVHDSGFPFICMVSLYCCELQLNFSPLNSHHFVFLYLKKGRAYFLSAGFSLAFGAMFTKTFRVHRIFSMRNSLLKNKVASFYCIFLVPLAVWFLSSF